MLTSRTRTFFVAAVCVVGLTASLSACTAEAAPATSGSSKSGTSKPSTSDGGDTGSEKLVLPGTGRYAIGTEAPLGGYQLKGEPDEQPSGCTWSIQDADGVTAFENTGQYAFLTHIKEAVTFVTDGCPDWEKFE